MEVDLRTNVRTTFQLLAGPRAYVERLGSSGQAVWAGNWLNLVRLEVLLSRNDCLIAEVGSTCPGNGTVLGGVEQRQGRIVVTLG